MTHLNYCVVSTGCSAQVRQAEIDAAEQAGVIDRALLPVAAGQRGWAFNRKSGYYVTGEIRGKGANFVLLDDAVPIALLAVCLHQRSSAAMWESMHAGAQGLATFGAQPPQPAWAALRYDVPEVALPPWIDWWAKHVGYALMTREGW